MTFLHTGKIYAKNSNRMKLESKGTSKTLEKTLEKTVRTYISRGSKTIFIVNQVMRRSKSKTKDHRMLKLVSRAKAD